MVSHVHASPRARPPLEGARVAHRYRIGRALGEGSMARVFEAVDETTGAQVAIKILHPRLSLDPRGLERFRREAEATKRLDHPGTVRMFDFGRDDKGLFYLVMERVEGRDLNTLIAEEAPLTPRRVVNLLSQILRALSAAHTAGVLHRDLKPENVLVDAQDRVKLCDFGMAKLRESQHHPGITASGFVCGTPEFMAPEQAQGRPMDERADLYAVGCVMYQLMTGEMPFTGDSALETIEKHVSQRPRRPRRVRPDWFFPLALERVCLTAMQKAPSLRYQSAEQMSEALAATLTHLGQEADHPLNSHALKRLSSTPPRPTDRWWPLWLTLGVGVVLAVSAALM